MAESEVKFTPFILGDRVEACYKVSRMPIVLKVKGLVGDNVVLSPDGKKTVIASPEVLLHGGVVGRFEFRPQVNPVDTIKS